MPWLLPYLTEVVAANVCTKIHCTTCGAMDFRKGLLARLSDQTDRAKKYYFEECDCFEIAQELSAIEINPTLEKAIMFILYNIYNGTQDKRNKIEGILSNSWAGNILDKMKEHYAKLQATRKAREEYDKPENALKRRDCKKISKQEQHKKDWN